MAAKAGTAVIEKAETKSEQLSNSKRFTESVIKEFSGNVSGALQVTDYQRTLIQGYFIQIDRTLKANEEERVRKNENNTDHKYDNDLPFIWDNVNLSDLALDAVHYARMGLDMMQDNHLFPIPYKNKKRGRYDVTLMPGYNGVRYMAEKYAVEPPSAVTVEVVYANDTFRAIKKTPYVRAESYEFEVTDAFNRGDIVGGFAYIEYDDPCKNELVIMSLEDIEKRKPQYASPNFWGGTQKVWENGKQVEVENDGWLDEMARKTLIREAYSAKHIPRDPKKIEEDYQQMKLREARYAELEAQVEIDAKANAIPIDTPAPPPSLGAAPDAPHVDTDTGEIIRGASVQAENAAPVGAPSF